MLDSSKVIMATSRDPLRLLTADDDRGIRWMLEIQFRTLSIPSQLEFAEDGAQLLKILQEKGTPAQPLPNLILLDLNMPYKDGLETLQVLKSHAEWSSIPVIIFSTFAQESEVRNAYEAGANCYLQKPSDLAGWERLVHAIAAFWAEFAIYPRPAKSHILPLAKGTSVAVAGPEASSEMMWKSGSRTAGSAIPARHLGCDEQSRLRTSLAETVKELLGLHQEEFDAIVQGDAEWARFDLLIHMANEKKQQAKYNFVRHLETHGCSSTYGSHQNGTGSDQR
jgi:CheY-like chemotaxis protein